MTSYEVSLSLSLSRQRTYGLMAQFVSLFGVLPFGWSDGHGTESGGTDRRMDNDDMTDTTERQKLLSCMVLGGAGFVNNLFFANGWMDGREEGKGGALNDLDALSMDECTIGL